MFYLARARLFVHRMLPCSILVLSVAWHSASAATLSGSRAQGHHPELEGDGLSRRMWTSVRAGGSVGGGPHLMRAAKHTQDRQQAPSEAKALPRRDGVATIAGLAWMSAAVTETAEIHSSKTANLTADQDCEWYDWSPWSYCSKTCGNGYHTRQRSIAIHKRNDGAECVGDAEEVGYCNSDVCPLDCQWGDWDPWSKCTHSCDGGTRQRGRPILMHNNSLGTPCSASDGQETGDCGTTPCKRDCQWSEWSVWSMCSASCAGGNKSRQRSVAQASSAGGLECEGNASQDEVCNVKLCPKDCELGDWADWETCSTTCGNGTKVRQRAIARPEEGGGAQCNDSLIEEMVCTIGPCRSDCIWGNWTNWSSCAVSCGASNGTISMSYREVAEPALAGGAPCEGESLRSRPCGQSACPVDCQWSHWTTWRECSKTCGGGITDRYRNHSIVAENGGVACNGSARDVKRCATAACPADCRLSEWSDWSDCSSECGAGEITRSRSEIVPATPGGRQCEDDTSQQKQCVATDCATVAWLLKTGAVAVSGAMEAFTEDPISFASNQQIEQATKRFLTNLPRQRVTRVHAAMMPSNELGGGDGLHQHVHIWFSMIIPNSSNSELVIEDLEKFEKDPRSCSVLYRKALASEDIKAEVNVTEFTVGKIKKLKVDKFFVTYKNKTTDNISINTSRELVDWNNPLRPRVNCALRFVPPPGQQGESFGEGDKTLKAVEKTYAEMASMSQEQVRSSQVPKRAINVMQKFVDGASLSTEQKQAWNASMENTSVDALTSLLGEKADNEIAAVNQAYDMSNALMREDYGGVTDRLNDNLNQAQAKSWTPSQVSFTVCRAVGDVPTWYDGMWRDETDSFFGGAIMHLKATPASWSVEGRPTWSGTSWLQVSSRRAEPYQLIPTPTQVTLRETRDGKEYDYVFDAAQSGNTMQISRGSQTWTLAKQDPDFLWPGSTPEQKQKEIKQKEIRVTGVLEMQVFKARMFSSDARTELACKRLLSQLLDMPINLVQVSVVPKIAVTEGEYYESLLQQRDAHASLLQLGGSMQPKVEEISENELDSMDDLKPQRTNGLADETMVFAWFVLHFSHNQTAADSAVHTIRKQDGDLAMLGLKLQNLLMDMRMTISVTLTNIKADQEVPDRQRNDDVPDNSTRIGQAILMEDGQRTKTASGLTSLLRSLSLRSDKSAAGRLCFGLVISLGVVFRYIT